jgi:type IV pilus biogenesis protein CpaD/CtpE
MKKLIVMALALLALGGCAGMTPQQTATTTLLGIHDTIVNVETGIKVPCAQSTIPAATCATIEGYILQAKPAYNTVVDAQMVWLSSNSATDQASYLAKKQALDQFVGDAVALALKYGVVKEPANGSSN